VLALSREATLDGLGDQQESYLMERKGKQQTEGTLCKREDEKDEGASSSALRGGGRNRKIWQRENKKRSWNADEGVQTVLLTR